MLTTIDCKQIWTVTWQDETPLNLPFDGQPFVTILWNNRPGYIRASLLQRLLQAESKYLVFGGHDCERWHDEADNIHLTKYIPDFIVPDQEDIMTTWHTGDPIEEAIHPRHRSSPDTASLTMPVIHKELSAGRWLSLSLIEQLANVGSEVERTIRATKAGNDEQKERAFCRTLELLDITRADQCWQVRRKELCRVREVLCDVFRGDNMYNTSFEWLSQYFLEYGTAARLHR